MCDLPQEVQESLKGLEEHYESFQEVNKGANGYLFLAKNKISEQEVAIKFYAGEEGLHQHDEPKQLAAITSQNVLPILDVRVVAEDWGYFITPKCHEGDLDNLIKNSPSAHLAIDTALGICNGVSEIHSAGMLHRDLKPGNIVIDDGQPKIADFGSVKAFENGEDSITASRHSILFRPPESFASDRYTVKGDIYQVGLLIYQLLGGLLPYDGKSYLNKIEARKYNQIDDLVDKTIFIDQVIRKRSEAGTLVDFNTLPPWVNPSVKRCLKSILHPNPDNRLPTIAEVAAVLTQMRSSMKDWCYVEDVITLYGPGHVIEIHQTKDGDFAAFKKKNKGAFRMISKMKDPKASNLIKEL